MTDSSAQGKRPYRANKLKRLNDRLANAQNAVDQYSKGILTPLERALKCDVSVLLKNWTKTRDEIQQEINSHGKYRAW